MRRDVDQPLALLRGVEEPRRPLERHARHQLGKVMDAFLGDRGIFDRACDQSAEHRSDGRELLLQHRRDLVPLGHDVVEQHAACRARPRTPCPARRSPAASIAIGLSASVWKPAATARDRYSVLRRLLPEMTTTSPRRSAAKRSRKSGPVWSCGAPARRVLRPRVVAVDLAQVVVEVRPLRRVDVHRVVDVGVHLLLHQRRVEMARVEDGELQRLSLHVRKWTSVCSEAIAYPECCYRSAGMKPANALMMMALAISIRNAPTTGTRRNARGA